MATPKKKIEIELNHNSKPLDYKIIQGDAKYCVYVLECKTPEHYYVGITHNLAKRIRDHSLRRGARFTQIHGVKKLVKCIQCNNELDAKQLEKKITQPLIHSYGRNNVCGGGNSQVIFDKFDEKIQHIIEFAREFFNSIEFKTFLKKNSGQILDQLPTNGEKFTEKIDYFIQLVNQLKNFD